MAVQGLVVRRVGAVREEERAGCARAGYMRLKGAVREEEEEGGRGCGGGWGVAVGQPSGGREDDGARQWRKEEGVVEEDGVRRLELDGLVGGRGGWGMAVEEGGRGCGGGWGAAAGVGWPSGGPRRMGRDDGGRMKGLRRRMGHGGWSWTAWWGAEEDGARWWRTKEGARRLELDGLVRGARRMGCSDRGGGGRPGGGAQQLDSLLGVEGGWV